MDTLGRMHFWGDVGSLQIESYYADGKRYAKIQDGYIKNDDWTWKEVPGNDYNRVKWFDAFKTNMQNINCQEVGTQNIKSKVYKILTYSIQKPMPKSDGEGEFMMLLNVKTWFCPETNLSYKDVYGTTTEKGTTIQSTIEYDVPVKIEIPKNARYEAPKQVITPPIVAEKVQEAVKITPPIVAQKVQEAVKITPPIVAEK